jgi:hypothetical protein
MSQPPKADLAGFGESHIQQEIVPRSASSSPKHAYDVEHQRSVWSHLRSDINPKQATGPLAAYCFMTGFM